MKSRDKILQAARMIFESKDFNDVTVGDIIALSRVARSTFYRHFIDKYDVLIQTVYYGKGISPNTYDYKCSWDEHISFFIQAANQMELDKKYISRITKAEGPNSFWSYCFNWFKRLFEKRIAANSTQRVPTVEEDIALTVYCHGVVIATTKWLNNECEQPPEQFARILCDCIPTILLKFFSI